MAKVTTLSEFIINNQKDFPYETSDLSRLLSSIQIAAKIVNREVNRAGLTDNILGAVGSTNVQGEEQQKLDVYANDRFIEAMASQKVVCGIGSEENDHFLGAEHGLSKDGQYIVMMDPLDGSSNIDVNVSIGTIFSIYRRVTPIGSEVAMEDFLQPGNRQVAAGYVVYGSSTMLVFSTGNGVNGFTLEPSLGLFCLSHPNLKSPEGGKIYSINEGNFTQFSPALQNYIHLCKSDKNINGKAMSARYIGSLVADFHRNLLKGGIYIYPGTKSAPNGKLRLLYEANPLAFLIEQAGGSASNGNKRILDIHPTELHQRCPLFIGSKKLVDEAVKHIASSEKTEALG
ncbi:class 1 fructose-bisphosphatase [Luteibaculum oceani]|uniref:Fructose-1,6-bisphosphatase class 1 n=1 Tax=Luteibaculum oceani TaxID=1294296 RepID=A0A5C6VB47_9FLAO|nr:class 1 fructose-bisphosphatase [Luteibaculum oceani]TXC81831.1 class 1 fructose-bisphosphatase [Luteibaculum oceani]